MMRRRVERIEDERSEAVAVVHSHEAGQQSGFRMILAEVVAIGFLTIAALSLLPSTFGLHTISSSPMGSIFSVQTLSGLLGVAAGVLGAAFLNLRKH